MTGRRLAHVGVAVGLGMSVAANIAHAVQTGHSGLWAVVLAAFWPVALFLSLEILTRTPWARGWHVLVARAGVVLVAGVTAWISYGHLRGVVVAAGETGWGAMIAPLAIDGLMAVSASALLTGQMSPADVTPTEQGDVTPADTPDATRPARAVDTRQVIIEHLTSHPDGATVAELMQVTGKTRNAVTGHLQRLECRKRGTRYMLPAVRKVGAA